MRLLKSKLVVLLYCFIFLGAMAVCYGLDQAVTTAAVQPGFGGRTVIVIDAGHGGIDGGATAVNGKLESHINLQIALRLQDLMHLLGYDTYMIRTTDTSIYTEGNTIASQKVSDLKNRVRIVNETANCLLISIHQNTYPDSRYAGAQVFYGKNEECKAFASTMQTALNTALCPNNQRQIKSSKGIYLMENIEKCGVLIECGFISNPQDASNLCSEAYQMKLCSVIAATTASFKANT